jgi:hypothetical protein
MRFAGDFVPHCLIYCIEMQTKVQNRSRYIPKKEKKISIIFFSRVRNETFRNLLIQTKSKIEADT